MTITEAQRETLANIRSQMSDVEIAPTELGGEVGIYGFGRVLHVYGGLNRVTIFPDGRYTCTDYGRTNPRPVDMLTE